MMNLFSEEMRRDPFPLYDTLRSGSPLFHEPRSGAWAIFDYEGVKRALHDHDAFSSVVVPPTGKAPDWLVFTDPPRHEKLRALVTRAFTPRTIAGFEPRIRALSCALLDERIEAGEMDLVRDYAGSLPTLVIAEMMGIHPADRPRLLAWSEIIMNLGAAAAGGEEAARAVREHAPAKEEMRAYLRDLLAERRRAPADDLLTRLADAEVDGERLTEEDLLGFFQLLLAAGTETTTNLISNAVLSFVESPAELARVEAAPERWPAAVEEILRHRSPVQIRFDPGPRAGG